MTSRRILAELTLLLLVLAGCAPQTLRTPIASPVLPPPQALTAAPTSLPAGSQAPTAAATPTTNPGKAQTTPAYTTHMPDPAAYTWVSVASGIQNPTDIKSPLDSSGRLFILEQRGRILILKNGTMLDQPFLDISDRVGSSGSEQGLLGLAFHPKFSQNGFFYVNYTDLNGNTHIVRFTASGDSADPGSEKKLLLVQQPFPNHNGGALAFDPSGYLMIGLGDGGSGGDPYGNAQSTNTLLGKILRLDVDGGDPYAIPVDNPFAKGGGKPEIWAYGLRNPWRFSFDHQTNDLWIADVGQNMWEEIDYVPAGTPGGLNFGWNKMEATHPFKGENQPGFTAPVAEYSHNSGCSVSGGYVYRGASLPEWQGVYFYGDYCSGKIWGLASPPTGSQPVELFQTGFKISTFGLDDAGELYVADYGSSTIYRLKKRP